MGLSKEIVLTVKDYEIKLNRDIKFYENDTIDLCFSILEYGIEVKDGVAVNKLMPINALKAYMLIETPQGVDYAESTKVENNRVVFNLGNKYSQFIGIGRMQIVIKDNDGCRITLPEFPFEIRESINSNWDRDIAVLSTEENEIIIDEFGRKIEMKKISEMEEANILPIDSYSMILDNNKNKKIKTNLITQKIENDLQLVNEQLDNITTEVNNHITNHPIGGSGTLNKLEILEVEPSGDELYEGRIWLYKAPDLSCTNITLSSNTLTFTSKEPQTLTYITVPSNTTDIVEWNVEPSHIVTISNGVVTPNYNGECTITVTCGSQSASCNVTVSGIEEDTIPKNGLQIWIDGADFTNSPQTTTLIDKSGNSNNFTARGFDCTTSSGLNDNNQLVFDGKDDKLYITKNNISLNISSGFTLVFKASINNLSQTKKELVDCSFEPDNKQLTIIYGYVNNTIELYGNSLEYRTGSQITINDTNVHTIIYSYDGSILKGYLDNNEVVSVSKAIALDLPILEVTIGGNSLSTVAAQSFTNITLDKLLIYNRALTNEEITMVNSI